MSIQNKIFYFKWAPRGGAQKNHNKYLKNKKEFNIEEALFEIIKIHNNKKHSTTKRIPKDIRDLNDKDEIELIKKEIINELQRKNKYAYVINYENFMF